MLDEGERRAARRWRVGLLAVLVVAAALRLYPILAPYQHPEQELVPQNALMTLARGDFRPLFLSHGSAFLYTLRGLYWGWYHVAKLTGRYHDRYDLLVDWIRHPLPFLIAGRVVVALAGIATVALVAGLGRAAFDARAGLAGALLLAVSFIHVRESHHVWYDVPATCLVVAAVWAALLALRDGGRRARLAAAALGGAAIATKHPVAPVALPVAFAALAGSGPGLGARLRAAAGVGLVALAVYALLCPYTFLDLPGFLATARLIAGTIVEGGADAATFPTLARAALGVAVPAVAVVGVAVALRRAPREAVLLALFPVAYLAVIASGQRIHARYLAPPAPFVALFAGAAVSAAAARVAPRRAGAAAAVLALALAAAPAWKSATWVTLLGRADTRALAGAWIAAHVPPGTPISVAAANGYPNPTLPWSPVRVALTFPAMRGELLARGAADAAHSWPESYQTGLFGEFDPKWRPTTPVVVTAEHPGAIASSQTPPVVVERLRAAGYRPVATFVGFDEPLRAIYDPIDADYLPIAHIVGIRRPGPNLTVWERAG